MKKIYTVLFVFFVSLMACKCQLSISGGAGLAYFRDISSLSGQIEAGYKTLKDDCYNSLSGGLMVAGGMISMLDSGSPATFYLKGGKSFSVGYGQEIELSGGYSWRMVSNDDKSRNSKAPIFSLSWLNQVSDRGQWVVNVSGGKGFVSGSIGMRITFINYKKY